MNGRPRQKGRPIPIADLRAAVEARRQARTWVPVDPDVMDALLDAVEIDHSMHELWSVPKWDRRALVFSRFDFGGHDFFEDRL